MRHKRLALWQIMAYVLLVREPAVLLSQRARTSKGPHYSSPTRGRSNEGSMED